jgi:hypothetical protein
MPKAKADIDATLLGSMIAEAEDRLKYKICGYPSYDESGNVKICKQKAGYLTHHSGVGRCKFHGGSGRSMTTGAHSKYLPRIRTVDEFVSQWKDIQYRVETDYTSSMQLTDGLVKYVQQLKNRDIVLSQVNSILDTQVIDTPLRDSLRIELTECLRSALTADTIYQVEAIRRLLETKYKLLKSQIDLLKKDSDKREVNYEKVNACLSYICEYLETSIPDISLKAKIFKHISEYLEEIGL